MQKGLKITKKDISDSAFKECIQARFNFLRKAFPFLQLTALIHFCFGWFYGALGWNLRQRILYEQKQRASSIPRASLLIIALHYYFIIQKWIDDVWCDGSSDAHSFILVFVTIGNNLKKPFTDTEFRIFKCARFRILHGCAPQLKKKFFFKDLNAHFIYHLLKIHI